ncbi:hypothetical protein K458DRAFT_2093 [Lentithecium fluviatile CBS 122367]|uniref:Uncharacterized protein n=1 Tax=Lentithecium fluviatile CBS 122367 TaxID=1168545 RepID=A0A6G1JN08_9PLEO|nr:hypothetical protein K458DRAFT_2093 [Lentithecium fluviatile CBS 122367]
MVSSALGPSGQGVIVLRLLCTAGHPHTPMYRLEGSSCIYGGPSARERMSELSWQLLHTFPLSSSLTFSARPIPSLMSIHHADSKLLAMHVAQCRGITALRPFSSRCSLDGLHATISKATKRKMKQILAFWESLVTARVHAYPFRFDFSSKDAAHHAQKNAGETAGVGWAVEMERRKG